MHEDEPPRPTGVRWRVFALACGTSFLLYLHRYTWNIVGPKLQDEFGFSNLQISGILAWWSVAYGTGQHRHI